MTGSLARCERDTGVVAAHRAEFRRAVQEPPINTAVWLRHIRACDLVSSKTLRVDASIQTVTLADQFTGDEPMKKDLRVR